MEVAICPNCKKEVPGETKFCHHCSSPIVSVISKQVFSWPWIDKITLFSVILIGIAFFQPWVPGSVIYEDGPLSAFRMLMSIGDLDIDFLESYNILRMALMVPLLGLLLFLLTYLRRSIQESVFLPLFLLIVVVSAFVPALIAWLGKLWGALLSVVLVIGVFAYFKNAARRGRLGPASHFILSIFLCFAVFLYHMDLAHSVYLKFETLHFTDTFGYWITWLVMTLLLVFIALSSLKRVEDFWLLVSAVILSLVGYRTFINPLFLSGPFAFFADNFSTVGEHALTHIRVVAIAQVIAISTAVPIGIYITRNPTAANIVLYLTSIVITIPSIALFGFMMPILSTIDRHWDAVSGIGIGQVPAIIALALYSQLPIIRNTYIAIKNVDPSTIEAGRGMGMTRFQLLIQLQLPLAAPIIMAGVRTAVVMSIAIAAIAAYIGAGGLGLFVSEGLQMATNDSVIAGAISMGVLAILADIVLQKTEDWLTPTGLKIVR
jgi:osmoprotectant transport system permease protein